MRLFKHALRAGLIRNLGSKPGEIAPALHPLRARFLLGKTLTKALTYSVVRFVCGPPLALTLRKIDRQRLWPHAGTLEMIETPL